MLYEISLLFQSRQTPPVLSDHFPSALIHLSDIFKDLIQTKTPENTSGGNHPHYNLHTIKGAYSSPLLLEVGQPVSLGAGDREKRRKEGGVMLCWPSN